MESLVVRPRCGFAGKSCWNARAPGTHHQDALRQPSRKKARSTQQPALDRIADHCRKIAARLGLTDEVMSDLGVLSMLHDIGNLGIRHEILMKSGPLTPEEPPRDRASTGNRAQDHAEYPGAVPRLRIHPGAPRVVERKGLSERPQRRRNSASEQNHRRGRR